MRVAPESKMVRQRNHAEEQLGIWYFQPWLRKYSRKFNVDESQKEEDGCGRKEAKLSHD